jgi:DNA polymerase/3'-5' exonuclease PolX|tara:strand:- start:148 stop:393 length:246 start_codon:yes stop_codon:yes gene_type:complete
MNKLEQNSLKQINGINEGILNTIARLFTTSKVKRTYKKAYKVAKDDPELQSALADLEDYNDRVHDLLKKLCKRRPDHKNCK